MRFVALAVMALGLACGADLEPRPPPPPGGPPGVVGRSAGPDAGRVDAARPADAAPQADAAKPADAAQPADAARSADALGVADAFQQLGDGAISCAILDVCPQGLTCCLTTTVCVSDPMTCPL